MKLINVTLFITVKFKLAYNSLYIIKFQYINMSQGQRADNRQVKKYTDVATLETLIGEKDQEITGV